MGLGVGLSFFFLTLSAWNSASVLFAEHTLELRLLFGGALLELCFVFGLLLLNFGVNPVLTTVLRLYSIRVPLSLLALVLLLLGLSVRFSISRKLRASLVD